MRKNPLIICQIQQNTMVPFIREIDKKVEKKKKKNVKNYENE